MTNAGLSTYIKTPIYRAPIYRVSWFNRASIHSPKYKLYEYVNVKCTPIYSAFRFTGPNSFPPRGLLYRRFTLLMF